MRLFRALTPATLLGFVLLALTGAKAEGTGLVVGGPPPNLFLLYTGDVIGYLDPCG